MCAQAHTTRHSMALGKARIMQPTRTALAVAPHGFKLPTFGLVFERVTDYATGAPACLLISGLDYIMVFCAGVGVCREEAGCRRHP